jgi:hypothetical protein
VHQFPPQPARASTAAASPPALVYFPVADENPELATFETDALINELFARSRGALIVLTPNADKSEQGKTATRVCYWGGAPVCIGYAYMALHDLTHKTPRQFDDDEE